ncbi:MAG: hypothetical protein IJZ80_04545 [Clostridia bacterium]|nr:hypothetical protein [Clostridia bacterium]
MRKLIICLIAVLLLLCMSSCEDIPALESGTAAEKNEVTTEGSSNIGNIEDVTEGETKSNVSWTPFA